MSAYLLIIALEAIVLLAVWRWDERVRRAERDRRRHLRRSQADFGGTSATPSSPA